MTTTMIRVLAKFVLSRGLNPMVRHRFLALIVAAACVAMSPTQQALAGDYVWNVAAGLAAGVLLQRLLQPRDEADAA